MTNKFEKLHMQSSAYLVALVNELMGALIENNKAIKQIHQLVDCNCGAYMHNPQCKSWCLTVKSKKILDDAIRTAKEALSE